MKPARTAASWGSDPELLTRVPVTRTYDLRASHMRLSK